MNTRNLDNLLQCAAKSAGEDTQLRRWFEALAAGESASRVLPEPRERDPTVDRRRLFHVSCT
jgi:hypothetical protein